jgi:peptidoglycan/xylan/chitin deacetylase (PgdA/CDA1 family)
MLPMALENTLLFEGIARPGVSRLLTPLLRGRATIFMFHRFSDPANEVHGHDPLVLRASLERLRRGRHSFVSLESLFRSMSERRSLPKRAVAFTIDDGYYDHARIAAPVFAAFDCPVTTFTTTGFLDGELWFWWDRIEFVFAGARRRTIQVEVGGERVSYSLGGAQEESAARGDFIRRCKELSEADKNSAIDRLSEAADVEVPTRAPARYAPMTWDELRESERGGMTFGPHTRTHPILSKVSDEQAETELAGGWSRLREQAANPAPIFCYPNGQPGDFSDREAKILDRLGLLGAVVGTPGYATTGLFHSDGGRFHVPRYSYPDSVNGVVRYAAGVERAIDIIRRRG